MTIFLLLAPLVVQLVAIYLLSGYVNKTLYRRLGKTTYLLIMWPGVMVHELSHLAACLLTRTKVFEVKLFAPHEESAGSLVLGYVKHAKPRGPVSATLIGSAPFFGGAAALWLTLRTFSPLLAAGSVFAPFSLGGSAVSRLIGQYSDFFGLLPTSLDWRSWQAYLFLYLVVVLASHIAPSKPDIMHALQGVAGLMALFGIFWAVDHYFDLSTGPAVVRAASGWIGSVTVLLSYGLAFTLILALLAVGLEAGRSILKRK